MENSHIISALVENKPGVLQRVAGMFSRRGFNIDNITVGPTEDPKYSRMTLVIKGDQRILEQVVKQMNKLICTIKIRELRKEDAVKRELALIKIHTAKESVRSQVMQYVEVFRGNVVDVSPNTIIAEITGDPQKIDAFVDIISQFGIKEIARTGVTALNRKESIREPPK